MHRSYFNYLKQIKAPGFTLSEVLLVLSVIGIIAALTIPTLVQKVSNYQYVTGLKKAYSTMSQAYNLLLAENGGDISYLFAGDGSNTFDTGVLNAFGTKLNLIKNCGSAMGCWYDTPRKYLNGNVVTANLDSYDNNNYAKAILADGSMLLIDDFAGSCNSDNGDGPLDNSVCGSFDIDINGAKGPNTVSRDVFWFWITRTGVYPRGTYNDGYSCDPTAGSWAANLGCTAKVLTEGNMNY